LNDEARPNFTNQTPIHVVSSVMGAELANGVFRDSLGGWVDMVEASPPDDGVPIRIFTTDFQASLAALVLGITGGLVSKVVVVMVRESITFHSRCGRNLTRDLDVLQHETAIKVPTMWKYISKASSLNTPAGQSDGCTCLIGKMSARE